jgi:hypothetical protein
MVASSQQLPGYLASIKPDWKKPDRMVTIESMDLEELVADCMSRSLWNTPEFHNICSDENIRDSNVVDRLIRKAVIALNACSAFPCVSKAFLKVWPKALAGGDILLNCYREKFEFLDGQKFSILHGVLNEPRSSGQDTWPLRWQIRNLIRNKPTLDVMRIAIEIDKVDECYRGSARPTFIGILILFFFISAASFGSRFLIHFECAQNNNGTSTRNSTNPVLGYICNHTNTFEEATLGIGGLFLILGAFTLFSVGSVAVKIFEGCQRRVLHPERYERVGIKRKPRLLPFDRNDEVDTSVIRSTWDMSSDSSQVFSYNFESMDVGQSTDDEPFIKGNLVINDM